MPLGPGLKDAFCGWVSYICHPDPMSGPSYADQGDLRTGMEMPWHLFRPIQPVESDQRLHVVRVTIRTIMSPRLLDRCPYAKCRLKEKKRGTIGGPLMPLTVLYRTLACPTAAERQRLRLGRHKATKVLSGVESGEGCPLPSRIGVWEINLDGWAIIILIPNIRPDLRTEAKPRQR